MKIKGVISGMAIHYAHCCHPLPGERIVGIVTTGKGITVHALDCFALEKFNDMPEVWLEISWDREGESFHKGSLVTVLSNEPGSLADVTKIISINDIPFLPPLLPPDGELFFDPNPLKPARSLFKTSSRSGGDCFSLPQGSLFLFPPGSFQAILISPFINCYILC